MLCVALAASAKAVCGLIQEKQKADGGETTKLPIGLK